MRTAPPESKRHADHCWQVPTCRVGNSRIPRLFLGDHGFLSKYGSRLSDSTVTARMKHALAQATVGLAAGEPRCLDAATEAFLDLGRPPHVLFHADVPLTVNGRRVRFSRCMSSLYVALRARVAGFAGDPVFGQFLSRFAAKRPLSTLEIDRIGVHEHSLEADLSRVIESRPCAVTVGGDCLDFLLASGRFDLVSEVMTRYRRATKESGSSLAWGTYVGCLTDSEGQRAAFGQSFDAIMVPVNLPGSGMLPNPASLLTWARRFEVPIIAMHPLASGVVPVREGLAYLREEGAVSVAVVGASTAAHIDDLANAARLTWEENR